MLGLQLQRLQLIDQQMAQLNHMIAQAMKSHHDADLRLVTEWVKDQEGKTIQEVRRVNHESHRVTKMESILEYYAQNPKASIQEIADATDSTEQHVRKILKKKAPIVIPQADLFAEQQDARDEKGLQ